ncbi:hypothetical protein [Dokdonella sp.]|uniref:hypothetical protein n=1 Tax=Dokdonella sp. TaxID=2291710 RepID=UPI002BE4E93F|nr:hypothetical protein [Xanthomonadales bacterium]HQV72984.1 hypothetical protein [Dokdonella sp.]
MSKRRNPDEDLQRLLDADAGEFGAIYRRLPHPEPPRRLDRVVLANAARAVRGDRAPPAQRWLLGLGSAAGLVLAAGIAWQVGQQIDAQDAQTGAPRSERTVIPVQPITESARTQKSESVEAAAAMADQELPAEAAPAKPVSAPPLRRKATPAKPAPAAVPPPAPAAQAPPLLEQRAAEPQAAPPTAVSAADAAQAFPGEKDNVSSEAASGAARERRDHAAGKAVGLSAPKAAAEQSRAPAPSSSVKLRQNMHLAPQDWLAEIVRLKNAGRRQEAIENLRLFRRMHPDWQLSDELRRLAE